MTTTMVPCTSGKCGVKLHVLGSADQKACASGGANSYEGRLRHVNPPSLDANWTQEGWRVFKYDSKNQEDAAKKRELTIAGTPTGNNFADRIFRLRNNESKRREIAEREYAEGNWDEKVQESFTRLLGNAKKGQHSKDGGESVASFQVANSHRGFNDIKFVKNQDGIIIEATEQDGSSSRFRFSDRGISWTNEFTGVSIPMRNSGYFDKDSVIYRSERQRPEREYAKDLMELLLHCQNERNWL